MSNNKPELIFWPTIALIFLESFSTVLYFSAFTFFYLDKYFSFTAISALIGSTTLVTVFIGPRLSRQIDKSAEKNRLLSALCLFCGACVGLQVLLPVANAGSIYIYFAAWALVILFSVGYNPFLSILTQYVYTLTAEKSSRAYSLSEAASAGAASLAGVFMCLSYSLIGFSGIIALSSGMFIIGGVLFEALKIIPKNVHVEEGVVGGKASDESGERNRFRPLKRFWYISLAVAVFAFTETSFVSNYELIGFTQGKTTAGLLFLVGSAQGLLSAGAASLYPTFFSGWSTKKIYLLLLIAPSGVFLGLGFGVFVESARVVTFLGGLALLVVLGQWWGVFSLSLMRRVSVEGRYAETFSYFRIPRAGATFLGISMIGASIEAGVFFAYMIFNCFTLAACACLTYTKFSSGELEHL